MYRELNLQNKYKRENKEILNAVKIRNKQSYGKKKVKYNANQHLNKTYYEMNCDYIFNKLIHIRDKTFFYINNYDIMLKVLLTTYSNILCMCSLSLTYNKYNTWG